MATEIGFPPSPLFKIAREEGEGVLVSRIRPVRNYGLGEMHSLGEWHDRSRTIFMLTFGDL